MDEELEPHIAATEEDEKNKAALAVHGFVDVPGHGITKRFAPRPTREQRKLALATRIDAALASLCRDLPQLTRRMAEPRANLADLLTMALEDAEDAEANEG